MIISADQLADWMLAIHNDRTQPLDFGVVSEHMLDVIGEPVSTPLPPREPPSGADAGAIEEWVLDEMDRLDESTEGAIAAAIPSDGDIGLQADDWEVHNAIRAWIENGYTMSRQYPDRKFDVVELLADAVRLAASQRSVAE